MAAVMELGFEIETLTPYPVAVDRPAAPRYGLRRLVAVVLLLLSALATSRLVAAGLGDGPRPVPEAPLAQPGAAATIVIVQPGDTLWSIARRLQPEGDVRRLVDRLAAANGGAALDVGQRLVLP